MDGLLISELAEVTGTTASAVRFYERRGLVAPPERSPSGYRLYDDAARNRLLFITRAKQLGLSLDDIAELVAVWDGTNCGPARAGVVRLVDAKIDEVRARIVDLQRFAEQLYDVRTSLTQTDPPDRCNADLTCCAPPLAGPVTIAMATRRPPLKKDTHG